MSSDRLATFEGSVPGPVHRTAADGFEATLLDVIEPPTVGVPLPFDGVSLEAMSVETNPGPAAIERAQTGVTPANFAVADYGSVSLAADGTPLEVVSLYTSRHVAVVAASDVEEGMVGGYDRLADEVATGRDTQVFSTGPSSTADMGGLIQGVHGPSDTHVLVLEDR
ncbi:MAG: LUD domain-containing protein [Halodesulfurarchaeum sp.]